MLILALGIIIGLLIAMLDAVYAYRSKSILTDGIAKVVAGRLPKKREGKIIKMDKELKTLVDSLETQEDYERRTDQK